MRQQLCIEEDNIFTYGKYYLLLWNTAYKVGANHCNIELLCYVWHAFAGPIRHYIDYPLLEFWFPEAVYTSNCQQLHPEPQTWPSHRRPDRINPLGPEHCH